MIDLMKAPFPLTYRELWLPRGINENASLPSSRYNGHPLTFTGARRGTTVDGVHFDGTANSNINLGAIHSAAAKFWIKVRFKLDQPHTIASGDKYLWSKTLNIGQDYIRMRLDTASGKLNFRKVDATVQTFLLQSDRFSWEAGVWYTVIGSIGQAIGGGAASDGARLIIEGEAAHTDPDVSAVCNGGNLYLGNDSPPGANGFKGIEVDVVIGTDDLTATEEAELQKGIPPADAVNSYLLDEGRGLGAGIAIDRGTGANNGNIGSACTWAWGSCKQPIISVDGINDHAQSTAGVDITGATTLVWAGKMKSVYDSLAANHYFIILYIDANNQVAFRYDTTNGRIQYLVIAGGTPVAIEWQASLSIDDYCILIGTFDPANDLMAFYINGTLVVPATNAGDIGGAATAYIGANNTPALYDISKPLLVGLIDGAFSGKQALAYSRWLNKILHLGLTI